MENNSNIKISVKNITGDKNTTDDKQVTSKQLLKDFVLKSKIYGVGVDPLTKSEFVRTRRNQVFECAETRIAYNNIKASESRVNSSLDNKNKGVEENAEDLEFESNRRSVFFDLQNDYYCYLIVFDDFISFVETGVVIDDFINLKPIDEPEFYKPKILPSFPSKIYFEPFGDYDTFDVQISKITLIQKLHKVS